MTLTQVKKKTGVSLSKITRKTDGLDVDFGDGDVLHIEYYPAAITTKMIVQADEVGKSGNKAAELVFMSEVLSTIIKSWDFFLDEEKEIPYPITSDKLQELELGIIGKIWMDIIAAVNPEAIAAQG